VEDLSFGDAMFGVAMLAMGLAFGASGLLSARLLGRPRSIKAILTSTVIVLHVVVLGLIVAIWRSAHSTGLPIPILATVFVAISYGSVLAAFGLGYLTSERKRGEQSKHGEE
jgi:CHASE2 domain-containing sensor protein